MEGCIEATQIVWRRKPVEALRLSRHALIRIFSALAIVSLWFVGTGSARNFSAGALGPAQTAHAAGCALGTGGAIQHVIYMNFDNVHFMRDGPNVPSDMEQMPHLLSFFKNNGVFLTNNHTPLISHTANDLATGQTGLYPYHMGWALGQNSYELFHNPLTTIGFHSNFT